MRVWRTCKSNASVSRESRTVHTLVLQQPSTRENGSNSSPMTHFIRPLHLALKAPNPDILSPLLPTPSLRGQQCFSRTAPSFIHSCWLSSQAAGAGAGAGTCKAPSQSQAVELVLLQFCIPKSHIQCSSCCCWEGVRIVSKQLHNL